MTAACCEPSMSQADNELDRSTTRAKAAGQWVRGRVEGTLGSVGGCTGPPKILRASSRPHATKNPQASGRLCPDAPGAIPGDRFHGHWVFRNVVWPVEGEYGDDKIVGAIRAQAHRAVEENLQLDQRRSQPFCWYVIRSAPRRKQVPRETRQLLWARDGGRCVNCSSAEIFSSSTSSRGASAAATPGTTFRSCADGATWRSRPACQPQTRTS